MRKWAIAIYLVTTNLKGVSSMKLHRDLKIAQKNAWHMLHRIRKAMQGGDPLFRGPVEADETYIGGKEANKHNSKKLHTRGTVGKTAVAGMKDRETNQITAMPVESVDRSTLQGFVRRHTSADTIVYTDEAAAYVGLRRPHKAVNHSAKEFVDGMWPTPMGWSRSGRCSSADTTAVYHQFSVKHLHRYVGEFEGRHNDRPLNTIDQMAEIARGMFGHRLWYQDLIA